jgi:sigma-54 dependent transcriptional regulator, acetoin dehydrogenase operon transcriptional activator AcoR
MLQTLIHSAEQRLRHIQNARQALLHDGQPAIGQLTSPWIAQSWQRCLDNGLRPHQAVSFDMVSQQALRRSEEANHTLLQAARPALKQLGHAIAETRYFAILTNADGMVVDVSGQIDRSDPRASVIARVGIDLSEKSVGTTAISAALNELHPVWLHRGEHFFDGNSVYSCAGAPLFGPDGEVVGMLDLTGIEVDERPELKHLVAQSARSIENALTLERAHKLQVRLNWPGRNLGDETDGLVCLDADGWVTGANQAARQMVSQLAGNKENGAASVHSSELFAMPYEMLFDSAGRESYGQPAPIDVPLWSGLRLNAISIKRGYRNDDPISVRGTLMSDHPSLREVETALIRKAVVQAKGNVMQAARELGISRATVYRKLGNKKIL